MISAFIDRPASRIYQPCLIQIKKSLKNCFSYSYKVGSAAWQVPKKLSSPRPGSKPCVHLSSSYLHLYTNNPVYLGFFLL
jgi:hypothetical protein